MSEPYYPAKAGDPIVADDWNNLQIKAREEIRSHTHTGGVNGKQLDGNAINPTSNLTVNELRASIKLTVNDLDVYERLKSLSSEKLSYTGGSLRGDLNVAGKLTVKVDDLDYNVGLSSERLRTVRGSVLFTGAPERGTGYTVAKFKDWPGVYKVTFTPVFREDPTVVASACSNHMTLRSSDVENAAAVDLRSAAPTANVIVLMSNTQMALFKTSSPEGKADYRHFHFIAIGPA